MSSHITPEQARELLKDTTPGPWEERYGTVVAPGQEPNVYMSDEHDIFVAEGNYVSGYADNGADAKLTALAPTMASMIAEARTEYTVARDSAYGWPEYHTQWGGWTTSKAAAWWHRGLGFMEKRRVEGTRIITRLVIDLEEEA